MKRRKKIISVRQKEPTIAEYTSKFSKQRIAMGQLSPLTIRRDRYEFIRIEHYFGKIALSKLNAQTINTVYAQIRINQELSVDAVYKLHKKLKQVMQQAVREQLITHNPCIPIKLLPQKQNIRNGFSQKEALRLAVILRGCKQSSHVVAVWLALVTGMRRGEILGLTWRYVDLDGKRIFIARQYAQDLTLRQPKSSKANRWISIDDSTVAYLASWQKRQNTRLNDLQLVQKADTPVISSKCGSFIDPSVFSRWRRGFFAANGFGSFTDKTASVLKGYQGLNLHDLRHTQATLLIGIGTDIKTVQHRLGHSNISTTVDIYAHALVNNDIKAASQIGELFNLSAPD
ncbi:site-specific integrase [Actinomycetota bacterium]|nr:site-specific integrase [Actinomycetota bacterium]